LAPASPGSVKEEYEKRGFPIARLPKPLNLAHFAEIQSFNLAALYLPELTLIAGRIILLDGTDADRAHSSFLRLSVRFSYISTYSKERSF